MPDYDKIKRNIGKMIDQGAPEEEINAYISSEGITAEQLRKAPKLLPQSTNFKQTASNIYHPVLEATGMAGGAILGTPANIFTAGLPVGTVTGGGLGFAGGKQLANILDDIIGLRVPPELSEQLLETSQDFMTGALATTTGEAANPIFRGAFRGMAKFSRKLYESALKPAPSLERGLRESAITTGLEQARAGEPYRPTMKHLFRLHNSISRLIEEADNIVTKSPQGKIKTQALVNSLDDVAKQFKQGPFSKGEVKVIEGFKKQIAARGEEITSSDALAMKKRIYQIAAKFYNNPRVSIAPVKIEAEKAIARALKDELETLYPAIGPKNRKASQLIDFGKILERSTSRIENRELLSLFDPLGAMVGGQVAGAKGTIIGGITSYMGTSPHFKTFLAKEIYKMSINEYAKSKLTQQILSYGVAKGIENIQKKDINLPEIESFLGIPGKALLIP